MVLDYFDSHGNAIPMPTSDIVMTGYQGYVTYFDSDHPEKGDITIPLDTFAQVKAYMDHLTSSNRYKNVTWMPSAVPIAPPKEI